MEIADQATCLDPYFASFEESLSSRNYKPETLKNYRYCFDASAACSMTRPLRHRR